MSGSLLGSEAHLSLGRALVDVVLCGDDCEVRGAILKRVPEGRIGGHRAVPVAPAPSLSIGHREAACHGHPTLAARVIPCALIHISALSGTQQLSQNDTSSDPPGRCCS